MSNTITAYFKGRVGVAEAVYQNDYGIVMAFDSIDLPAHFDCYFSKLNQEEAVPGVGADNMVAIPNSVLADPGNVTIHIPMHTGENDSEVEYIIYFKVIGRARPIDDGTPEQMTAIEQALALLQNPIGNIEQIVNEALAFTGETFEEMQEDLDEWKTDTEESLDTWKSGVESDFDNLEAQFQTAVSAVTTDTEVTNIRVGDDNVIYATAGEAVRTQFANIKDVIYDNVWSAVLLDVKTDGYYYIDGRFFENSGRRYAIIDNVAPGEKYRLSTVTSTANIPAIEYFNGDTFISFEKAGSGTKETVTNYEFTIPANANRLIVQNVTPNEGRFDLDKEVAEVTFYTKEETDEKLEASRKVYGVKWSINDVDDLGQRCFDAVGLNATIGIGAQNGSSDFDSIYPWSEIKRCNIKKNANGAEIVTFEGDQGFVLDGSNGDVFVRIPKFFYERYQKDGYEYRTISNIGQNPHPAFVEDGKELDEIFVGAFEGFIQSNKMRSIGGVLPTNNETGDTLLTAAQANGENWSLYDNRCVDAVWTLLAVEYGCRNTNHVLGYGLADFEQPVSTTNRNKIILAATNTNTIRTTAWTATQKLIMPVGSNITVCGLGGQQDILTQAKITAVVDGDGYTDWTFDGNPITVDTDCFMGSAPFNTNWCETVPSGALTWHTGRALWLSNSAGTINVTRNPIRYRWIENIFGNLWHFLPDVSFNDLQMYVCKNMKDYVMHKFISPYEPENAIYDAQDSNGSKADNTGTNYWVAALDNGNFTKAVDFGRTTSREITSKQSFGAYYYLRTGNRVIVNGGGFDHLYRCNMLTQRAWVEPGCKWYLYGARLMYKHLT